MSQWRSYFIIFFIIYSTALFDDIPLDENELYHEENVLEKIPTVLFFFCKTQLTNVRHV